MPFPIIYTDSISTIASLPPLKSERISAEERKLRANIGYLSIVDGLVMLNTRIYISIKLRAEVLRKLHSEHQGILKTTRWARESVWWPSINKEIQDSVESCKTCIKHHGQNLVQIFYENRSIVGV